MYQDEWANRDEGMHCRTCIFFVRKGCSDMGRCRRHAPTMKGFPIALANGWCGDHRLSEKAYKDSIKDGPDVPIPVGPLGAASSFVNTEKAGGSVQLESSPDAKMDITRKSGEASRLYRRPEIQD